jgi:PTH1 family peptidyl-tRNA hydrolase
MCVSYFARKYGIQFNKRQGKARVGYGDVDGIQTALARPQTYMNLSGQAVAILFKKLKPGIEDLIIVHDDLDLALGRIRIRSGGSSGGHNGVESIISEIGSADFTRVRVGIGRPVPTEDLDTQQPDIIAYVLSDFTEEESIIVKQVVTRVSEALQCLLTEGLVTAMNRYNAFRD